MRLALAVLLAGCDPGASGGLGGGGQPSDASGDGNTTTKDTGEVDDTGPVVVDTASLEGTGYQVGDVAYNLSGTTDQGEEWQLYGEAGRPVVLLVGDLDNSATNLTLDAFPDVDDAFPDALMVAMIGRDEYSTAADSDDAARWRDDFGLEEILLSPSVTDMALWSDNNPPKTYVIGADMVIDLVGYGIVSESDLSDALQAP